jgi:hypothetical protein
MTRADKLTWLCKVWATCPDYCRIAQHMYAGGSPSDICLYERISEAKLRVIIVGLAHTLANRECEL